MERTGGGWGERARRAPRENLSPSGSSPRQSLSARPAGRRLSLPPCPPCCKTERHGGRDTQQQQQSAIDPPTDRPTDDDEGNPPHTHNHSLALSLVSALSPYPQSVRRPVGVPTCKRGRGMGGWGGHLPLTTGGQQQQGGPGGSGRARRGADGPGAPSQG